MRIVRVARQLDRGAAPFLRRLGVYNVIIPEAELD